MSYHPDKPTPDELDRANLYGLISVSLILIGAITTYYLYYHVGVNSIPLKQLALEIGIASLAMSTGAAIAGIHSIIARCVLCLILAALAAFWGYIWWTQPSLYDTDGGAKMNTPHTQTYII